MYSANVYSLFSTDPAEYNLQELKSKLAISLIEIIRANEWSQAHAAALLGVSQPRVSNLMRGKIEKFSVDSLFEMLFRIKYKFDYSFMMTPGGEPRLTMKMKRATL